MRYADISDLDISNGNGVGVSLFVQGCPIHCDGCFNQSTWDFNGGKEWTADTKEQFLELVARPYVKRVTLLGGEVFAWQNVEELAQLAYEIRMLYPDKELWVYTGYLYEHLLKDGTCLFLLHQIDYLIDGPFQKDKKDLTLAFRGSSNQRIIDVQESLTHGKVMLYEKI